MTVKVTNSSDNWCARDPYCNYPNAVYPGHDIKDAINITNSSCILPFCVNVLIAAIDSSSVRIYDLVLLVLSSMFLLFLLVQLMAMVRKLKSSVPLFKILYFMVFVIPTFSCVYGVVAMSTGYYTPPAKIIHTILRGSILMTELCVIVFGLFFKFYNNKQVKLGLTVCVILLTAVLFTVVEGIMEYKSPLSLPCDDFEFFTHGGMIFLFSTSLLFSIAYLFTYALYLLKLHKRWSLPSKKSFYRYALFLFFVNLIQALGSLMWFSGSKHEVVGNTGICLTLLTNVVYITTFPPVVYWIFLSNYFRMNKDLKKEVAGSKTVNINSANKDSGVWTKSFTRPLNAAKRSSFLAEKSLLGESYGSSCSSYGSLNDEETFIRRLTPPEF